jgi:hypothetical protein
VHNKVNKRLAGDLTEDPEFPKIQFPSKKKCPECYLKETALRKAVDYTTFSMSDVLSYLKKYYALENIEGIDELNKADKQFLENIKNKAGFRFNFDVAVIGHPESNSISSDHNQLKPDSVRRNEQGSQIDSIKKPNDVENHGQIDAPSNIDKPIDDQAPKALAGTNKSEKKKLRKKDLDVVNDQNNRVLYDFNEFESHEIKTRSLDLLLSIVIYSLVLITFCCLYCYFRILRRRNRIRKARLI